MTGLPWCDVVLQELVVEHTMVVGEHTMVVEEHTMVEVHSLVEGHSLVEERNLVEVVIPFHSSEVAVPS